MKKKWIVSLLLAVSLLLSLGLCARAAARLDYVTDDAALLSADEWQRLNDSAAEISDRYDCGVYIVVVDDYRSYVSRGGIEYFAEEVFDTYDLGYGSTNDGVLLAMSMKERDFDVYAHGDFGNYAFTDYGKKELQKAFLGNFRTNDWAGGFANFIKGAEGLIALAKGGNPMDIWIPDTEPQGPSLSPLEFLVSLVVSCVVAGSTVLGFKKQMKTAVKKTRAEEYIPQGGVKLRGQRDDFVNRTVTRQAVPKSEPSGRSGGGHYGGTTISGSHGGSHSSGKF